ncbi:hypothetical protein FDECE_16667 [Fusarium decemcellulare]|nr:hypothetical protein FDECE_16667 [Fusarium decemcellulare]
MGNQSSSTTDDKVESSDQKKSLYQRYQDKRRGPGPSDEDILKYTGKTREELNTWADTQPGVGRNQLAGRISAGPTTGLGGVAAADGYGGWGPSAEPNDENRGMKFPPQKEAKKTEEET